MGRGDLFGSRAAAASESGATGMRRAGRDPPVPAGLLTEGKIATSINDRSEGIIVASSSREERENLRALHISS
jgi:hypothetical protein